MKLTSRAAAVTVAATLILGGAVMAASPASAVGSSACDYRPVYSPVSKASTNVNLRNGPSTSYYSKGLLTKGTRFDPLCSAKNHVWFYGKVLSGANAGKWGWVNGYHLRER
ncbi:SH3 domain-containing protein [Streptomyces sp. HNM0663]|uniref:SH3 domain-containing protein n=1 Tax=Streptomyces chengmaiensis TaxID=3040919 RepID=A0ABT6HP66_9ACTN|nr:SH3 domain-containing protein [Streptomyces chengmaiensis]MDH2390115.1 SH3 domain-containing protein [Streptomyces chengmaiensis]